MFGGIYLFRGGVLLDYTQFKKNIFELTRIDLNAYKEKQMKRRIDALISKHKFNDYDSYVKAIKTDTKLFEEFVNYLTINVSEFYRNPEQWRNLKNEIYPYLINNFGKTLKVWSAACSTGDEPYSLVMTLADFIPLKQIKIIATDLDKQVLEKAKAGLYNQKSVAGLPEEYRRKYMTKIGLNNYQVKDEVKACVEFKQHNLLKDDYPVGCDMIVCRNVVIYFTDEAKTEIYKKFHKSLKKGGILFVGSTEQIMNYRALNYESVKSFFYKTV